MKPIIESEKNSSTREAMKDSVQGYVEEEKDKAIRTITGNYLKNSFDNSVKYRDDLQTVKEYTAGTGLGNSGYRNYLESSAKRQYEETERVLSRQKDENIERVVEEGTAKAKETLDGYFDPQRLTVDEGVLESVGGRTVDWDTFENGCTTILRHGREPIAYEYDGIQYKNGYEEYSEKKLDNLKTKYDAGEINIGTLVAALGGTTAGYEDYLYVGMPYEDVLKIAKQSKISEILDELNSKTQTLFERVNGTFSKYDERFFKDGKVKQEYRGDSAEWASEIGAEINSLIPSLKSLKNQFNEFLKNYGENESLEQYIDRIEQNLQALNDVKEAAKTDAEFMNQFESEEEYYDALNYSKMSEQDLTKVYNEYFMKAFAIMNMVKSDPNNFDRAVFEAYCKATGKKITSIGNINELRTLNVDNKHKVFSPFTILDEYKAAVEGAGYSSIKEFESAVKIGNLLKADKIQDLFNFYSYDYYDNLYKAEDLDKAKEDISRKINLLSRAGISGTQVNDLIEIKELLEYKSKLAVYIEIPSTLAEKELEIEVDKGKERTKENPTFTELEEWAQKYDEADYDGRLLLYEQRPKIVDPLGMILKNPDMWHQFGPNSTIGKYILTPVYEHARQWHWEQIDEEEKKIYYFWLNRSDTETAMKYLELIESGFGKRYEEKNSEDVGTLMDKFNVFHKLSEEVDNDLLKTFFNTQESKVNWLLNVSFIPMRLIAEAGATFENLGSYIRGEKINPYNAGNSLRLGFEAAQSKGAQSAKEIGDITVFGKNVFEQAYNITQSAMESLVGIGIFGGLYATFAGSTAANQAAQSAYDRGGSNNQVFFSGLAAGISSALFERISIGNLLKNINFASTFKNCLKQICIQGAVEASEEFFTEISNKLADCVIMDEKSVYSLRIKELVDQNPSMREEDAAKKAFQEQLADVLWAAASGFISGSGQMVAVGGYNVVVNSINGLNMTQSQYIKAGADIKAQNDGQAVLDFAQKLDNEKLQKMLAENPKADNITDEDLGRVYGSIVDELRSEIDRVQGMDELDYVVGILVVENESPAVASAIKVLATQKLVENPSWIGELDMKGQSDTTDVNVNGMVEDSFRNGVGGKNTEVGGNNRVGVDSSNENGYYNIRGDGNDSMVNGRDEQGAERKRQTIKESQIRGVGKSVQRETKEAFKRRTNQDAEGIHQKGTLLEKGKYTFFFNRTDIDDTNGGKAVKRLEDVGARVIYCDGPIQINNGENTVSVSTALTTADGFVLVSNLLEIPFEQVTAHEIVHVMQNLGGEAYYNYDFTLCSNLNLRSDKYRKVAANIYIRHYLGELTDSDIDSRWSSDTELNEYIETAVKNVNDVHFESVIREIAAYINQYITLDYKLATRMYSDMFLDWDAVVQANKQFNDSFKADLDKAAFFMPEIGENLSDTDNDNILAFKRGIQGKGVEVSDASDLSELYKPPELPDLTDVFETDDTPDLNKVNIENKKAEFENSAFSMPKIDKGVTSSGVDGEFFENLTAGLKGEKAIDADTENVKSVEELSENVDENLEKTEKVLENERDRDYNKNKGSDDTLSQNNDLSVPERIRQKIIHAINNAYQNFVAPLENNYISDEDFESWFSAGGKDSIVYFGVDQNGKLVYTGITRQDINRRLTQHNSLNNPLGPKSFSGLVSVFGNEVKQLSRNQIRALEQYFFENGPNEKNRISSISKDSPYYARAMNWAHGFVKDYLSNVEIRRN